MFGDAYITRLQLGAYLGIDMSVNDPNRDSKLDLAIAASSRAVEDHCRRQFNTDGVVSQRVFKPTATRMVITDDFYDSTTVVVERSQIGSTTWSVLPVNNYEFEPFNGVVNGQPGWPYRRLLIPYYTYLWSIDRIRITAKWGWQAVPDSVVQAVYIIAAQYFKLSDAPLGVAGFGSGGDGFSAIKVSDVPQAWGLLCPYVVSYLTVD